MRWDDIGRTRKGLAGTSHSSVLMGEKESGSRWHLIKGQCGRADVDVVPVIREVRGSHGNAAAHPVGGGAQGTMIKRPLRGERRDG